LPAPFVADRGRGSPVLLLHGQPGLGSDWDAVVALLDDHRVLVPDRPGYGAGGRETLGIEESAAEFARLLVGLRAAPATVVGHSYGGGIAVMMAAQHPEVVSGLVLVASVGRADNVTAVDRVLAAPAVGEWSSAAGLFVLGRVLPPLRRLLGTTEGRVRSWLRATLPDSAYDLVSAPPGGSVWRSFVAEQRALLDEIDAVEAAVPKVRVPTVLVSGEWDVVVPPRVAQSMARDIAGSELVRVARTGHFVPRDAPETVARAVREVEERAREGGGPVGRTRAGEAGETGGPGVSREGVPAERGLPGAALDGSTRTTQDERAP
jgi:pimeloyl-ACP methyl ester carboxylesterase